MRLFHLVISNIKFQYTYGFYYLYTIFSVVYLFILTLIPNPWKELASTIMIYSDPSALGLFFMGAIILLENSENILHAIAVSPITVKEYIISKVISLGFISCIVALAIAFASKHNNIPLLLITTFLTSSIFTLLGIIISTKTTSLNQYLLFTIPILLITFIPPLIALFYSSFLLHYFPLSSSVHILSGGTTNLYYDIGVLIVTILVLYKTAIKMTTNMWRKLGGIRL